MKYAIVISLCCAALLVGCSPVSESEREYLDQRREEREKQREFDRIMEHSIEETEIVDMVKESDSPRAGLNTDQWVEEQIARPGGDLMFQHWSALPQGREKYRVEFTYTVMDTNNMIEKRGWFWTVNQTLELISAPNEIAGAGPQQARGRYEPERAPRERPLLNLE